MNITPLKSIRKYCLWCMNGQMREINLCVSSNCFFFKYRLNKGRPKLHIIRQKCLDCSGGSKAEIKGCLHDDCALFYYRFGKNPKLKGKRPNNITRLKGGKARKQLVM